MAPILPFFIVLGVGRGVPIALMGLMSSVVLITTVFAKPLLSMLADSFPSYRKMIFVGAVLTCGLAIGCICFVPIIGKRAIFPTSWIVHKTKVQSFDPHIKPLNDSDELFDAYLDKENSFEMTNLTNYNPFAEEINTIQPGAEDANNRDPMKWSELRLVIPEEGQ